MAMGQENKWNLFTGAVMLKTRMVCGRRVTDEYGFGKWSERCKWSRAVNLKTRMIYGRGVKYQYGLGSEVKDASGPGQWREGSE
jgi:hypothetical protein